MAGGAPGRPRGGLWAQLGLAARLARRDLRGGLGDFRIFLASLALGVAAIAAVGEIRDGILAGLAEKGAEMLGGDAELSFTYRFATGDERAWIAARAGRVSEIAEFRSMAVAGSGAGVRRALTQVKAVDDLYPLTGRVLLQPEMPLAQALAGQDGLPGAVLDPVLAARLGLTPGDAFALGGRRFRLTALLRSEPDAAAAGFMLGPRSLVRLSDLKGTGLLAPGSLFTTRIRLLLPEGTDLAALRSAAERTLADGGMRWRDREDAAPGIRRFVRRMGSFLVLVGLAGLAVGGVGVAAAVRAWLERRVATIATLKTLGADRSVITAMFLFQTGVLALLGAALGALLGLVLPWAAVPLLQSVLPFPLAFAPSFGALGEAALYGLLTAFLFTLWPVARAAAIRPAALYRDRVATGRRRPGRGALAAMGALLVGLLAAVLSLAAVPMLAAWTMAALGVTLAVLTLAGLLLRRLAGRAARLRVLRGHPALRLALGGIGGPGSDAVPVVLSLGLGLSVLAAIGQIDANFRAAITADLPDRAPAFFFIDIQPDQLEEFRRMVRATDGVTGLETAPMLRGIITRINGRPAREVAGDHWVVTGDRGITFAATPPPRTRLTAGRWWPPDYSGPPQLSFSAHEAAELGLGPGDRLTVNILGREITAAITSLRDVDFSSAGIGFVMVMNPAALAGAPYSSIATVHASPGAEAPLLNRIGAAFPNVTAIPVREVLTRVAGMLRALAAATTWGAAATLATGFVVLIGAAAAGQRGREYEAAILKTLGATRRVILTGLALRAALAGAMAGLVAVGAGALAGWAVMRFVMEAEFTFRPLSALAIVAAGAGVSLLAGLAFALRPLAARPARLLRTRD